MMLTSRPARASLLTLIAAVFLLSAPPASADLYGRGTYDSCSYQACITPSAPPGPSTPATSASPQPSPTPVPVTVDTSPGGMEFAVNLTEGQVIAPGTYTITVTPLNGQGRTFAKVEIYLDGALAASVMPATTGTFYWNWNTGSAPNRLVKIITFDQGGATTTREFNVLVKNASPAAIVSTGGSAALPQRIAEITQAGAEAVARAVRQIPVPVANAFPYLLFTLLGAGLLLLVIQARREVAEAEAMAAVIARERAIAADKDTFVQLASHYLCTPLTVIANGIDLGVGIKQLTQSQAVSLKSVVDELRNRVQQLLDASVATPVPAPAEGTALHAKVWLRPGFLMPILLLGALTFVFNVLVIEVGKINVSIINLLTQMVIFGLLALALYVLLRNRILRRRDTDEQKRIMDEQIRLDAARNQLIRDATNQLTGIVNRLNDMLAGLPSGQAVRIISDGGDRFRQTLAKFGAAAGLQSGHAAADWQQFQLGPIVDQAIAGSAAKAKEKKIVIETPEDTTVVAQHPNWLLTVLSSVIDNAVTYSAPGGKISIAAQAGIDGNTITVTDHGRGISEAALEKLFRPFVKTEGALTFDNEGMGFSLYLDKLIMTYLGGDITLKSRLGLGTSVTIQLVEQPPASS